MPQALVCAWMVLAPALAAGAEWPAVPLPAGLQAFDIGQQMSVNGVPMQLRGFVSEAAPKVVATEFGKVLGEPLVRNEMGGKIVLGRRVGAGGAGELRYLTVQIEAAPGGSRGVIAISDLAGAASSSDRSRDDRARWMDRLPSGSKVVNQIQSRDGDKLSTYLVATNRHALRLNADRLITLMEQDGYALERESESSQPPGVALFFRGEGREGMAVVSRSGPTHSTLVLNTITLLKDFR
ncbi:hypothetical protein V4F39_17145 [Aquincola sp. MAHUQ-54]|uniref:Uncharacterized protein n=1 Tax=Aquincola agrisoli TaxID=3119538 RepID=A0AAW9QJ40_9BURK